MFRATRPVVAALSVLALAPLPAGAQGTSPDASDVSVILSGPKEIALGRSFAYSVQVANAGPGTAGDLYVYIYLGEGLGDLSAPAAPEGCTWDGSFRPDGYPDFGGGSFTCSLEDLAPGGMLDWDISGTRVKASQTYVSAWAGSSSEESDYENNSSHLDVDADDSTSADVGVSKSAPKEIDVGDEFNFTIVATNAGPQPAAGVWVVDYLPEGVEYITAGSSGGTCSRSDGGSSAPPGGTGPEPVPPEFYQPSFVACDLGSIGAGKSKTVTLGVRRTSGWELYNGVSVYSATYDPNYDNDYATVVVAADPDAASDLNVEMQARPEAPALGEEIAYAMVIRNDGPALAGDVTVTDSLPWGTAFVAVDDPSCMYEDYSYYEPAPYEGEPGAPTSGAPDGSAPLFRGGAYVSCSLGTMEAGDSKAITLTVTRTSAYDLWNFVSAYSSNFDPNYSDNNAETYTPPDMSALADLSVSLTGPDDPDVGSAFEQIISVSNGGPDEAKGAHVSHQVPYGLELQDFESSDPTDRCSYTGDGEPQPAPPEFYGYRELRCELGNLPPGEGTEVTLTLTRTDGYEIWSNVWAETSTYDPDGSNDHATHVIGAGDLPPCDVQPGSPKDDSVVSGSCPVATGGGNDAVSIEADSSSGDTAVRTGPGADTVTLAIATGSASTRTIEVRTGGGNDVVDVSVLPGAEHARILIFTGDGGDRVRLDVSPLARALTVVVRGGPGGDSLRSVRYSTSVRRGVRLVGNRGADQLLGGSGPDRLFGRRGADTLDAWSGNDLLDGGMGKDSCREGPGDDSLTSCSSR